MKGVKSLYKIGVNLTEGCTLPGGEAAMQALSPEIVFDALLESDPSTHSAQVPLFLNTVVDLNQRLKSVVQNAQAQGHVTLVTGGDHALAIGSIAGAMQPNTRVLWIDAHGDCNTPESSLTQRIHGMPLATLMHHGHTDLVALVAVPLDPSDVLLIGTRDLDEAEKQLMARWGVRHLSMERIKTLGMNWLEREVMSFLNSAPHVHISFDCDSMDPAQYPGVNTAVAGGFSWNEVEPLMEQLIALPTLRSMDIVEFNPTRDNGQTKALILELHRRLERKLNA
jgi:arginase